MIRLTGGQAGQPCRRHASPPAPLNHNPTTPLALFKHPPGLGARLCGCLRRCQPVEVHESGALKLGGVLVHHQAAGAHGAKHLHSMGSRGRWE